MQLGLPVSVLGEEIIPSWLPFSGVFQVENELFGSETLSSTLRIVKGNNINK